MAKETIDNQNVKSKRDSFRERLAQRYPDLNMDDDEAVYGQLSTDYDQYDQNKQKMDDFNKMLQDNPHAPSLVTGLVTKKMQMEATSILSISLLMKWVRTILMPSMVTRRLRLV